MIKSYSIYSCKLVKESTLKYHVNEIVKGSDDAAILAREFIGDSAEEKFIMICISTSGGVIGVHEISHGELSSTIVHPREVYKRALLNNAAGIIVAHNHPSGDPHPSDEDKTTTKRLVDAGKILGIKVFDHIIIGEGDRFTSLRAEGYIY